jgi:DNA mismatch repair protein MutH
MTNERSITEEEIVKIGLSAEGKRFSEIFQSAYHQKSNLEIINKGHFGQLLEKNLFGIEANSDSRPDFHDAGIELKVTPIKRLKNGSFSAKERLVLNTINYEEEYFANFYTSSFWKKNRKLFIMFYLFEENMSYEDFLITKSLLFEYPDEDLIQIIQDWETISAKIKNGLAHELSESDTLYLGACTKGVNSYSMRRQLGSDILAKQRAYSLKTTYMTILVRKILRGEKFESIVLPSIQKSKSFVEVVKDRLSTYVGSTVSSLKSIFHLQFSVAKGINDLIVSKMLGLTGRVGNTEEFQKANIISKTVRIESARRIKESMSFPAFKYQEIVLEEWENSTLRNYFETTIFMFSVFVKEGEDYIFKGVKFWNMPVSLLDSSVKETWMNTVKLIKEGQIVQSIDRDGKRHTYFPGSSDNIVCHVRPHATNQRDTYPLPVKDRLTSVEEYTKHCFWLNSKYILSILSEFI